MPYNRIERALARFLDSAPALRRWAKVGYQRANYVLHGRGAQALSLHPQVAIYAVADAAGSLQHPAAERFFGYFGMSPWSADQRFQLFHRWRGRGERSVEICLHERDAPDSRVIGTSRAWNFQQGSLTQWLAGSSRQSVAFNDVVDRNLVCRILALDGGERVVPWPIQALHPDGTEALSINYIRMASSGSEYGYPVEVDNFRADTPLDADGLWKVDLTSGAAVLIASLQSLVASQPRPEMAGAAHKVNHAVYSPSGTRLVFMHRWLGARGKFSRLYCANRDGSDLRLLLDNRMVSHYAWGDEDTLLVWARTPENGDCYYSLDVGSGRLQTFWPGRLDSFGDGHPSFSPDGRWVVTDSYPDRARLRRLLLCRAASGEVIEVGAFRAPWRYDGAVRCDLHPRWSPDGRSISIDSAHQGIRSTYVVDVSRLVD